MLGIQEEQSQANTFLSDQSQPTSNKDLASFEQTHLHNRSTRDLNESILSRQSNNQILDHNNQKKKQTLLSSLYKVDDRSINFPHAKEGLLRMTREYVEMHSNEGKIKIDTEEVVQQVKELEWNRKQKLRLSGDWVSSAATTKRFVYTPAQRF